MELHIRFGSGIALIPLEPAFDLAAVDLAVVDAGLYAKPLKSCFFEPPDVEAAVRLPEEGVISSDRNRCSFGLATHDVDALVDALGAGRDGTAEVLEAEPARDPAGLALVEAVDLLAAALALPVAAVRFALAAALVALTTSRRAAIQRAFAPDSFHQSNCSSEASLMLRSPVSKSGQLPESPSKGTGAVTSSRRLEIAEPGRLVIRNVLQELERDHTFGIDVVFVGGLLLGGTSQL